MGQAESDGDAETIVGELLEVPPIFSNLSITEAKRIYCRSYCEGSCETLAAFGNSSSD